VDRVAEDGDVRPTLHLRPVGEGKDDAVLVVQDA
jgi:hypothetical protein